MTTGLQTRAAEVQWYHTLELPGGVVTHGHFDCRPIVRKVPLPESLAGKRCLDVGTWDGFWAFEMERRGADEVVAIDLDDPYRWDWPAHGALEDQKRYLADVKSRNQAFDLARSALDSRVERRDLSVYDLSPDLVGEFDFVYLGTLLMHLRDPVLALQALRSVCRGEGVVADGIDAIPTLTHPRTPVARLEGVERPWWWQPNRAGLHRMVESAGWEILERSPMYFMPKGTAHPRPRLSLDVLKAMLTPAGRERLVVRWLGVPHAAVRARPAV